MKSIVRSIWLLLSVGSTGIGLLWVILLALPYPTLKSLGNAISKDGNLQSLTPGLYQSVRITGLLAGILFLIIGILLFSKRSTSQAIIRSVIQWGVHIYGRFRLDLGPFLQDVRTILPKKWELLGISLMVGAGAVVRLFFINKPMEYDECYTFTEFAQYSFRQVITDYHVPNNHVFHTILVRVAFLLLGDAPWAIRMPVFIGGLLLIAATYGLARRLYNTPVAILSSGLVAMTPILVFYSVYARGYTLVALMTLLTLILGIYVSHHKNLVGWSLLILFSALGFYSIPIMLYPFGVLFTWLLFKGITHEISPDYGSLSKWVRYLLAAGLLSAGLTIFFYSPILLKNGITNFFNGAKVVDSIGLAVFISGMPARVNVLLDEWRMGTNSIVLWVILVGIVLSTVFHSRMAKNRFSMQASTALFLGVILLVQRPNAIARIWLWLVPLLLMWAAAGFVGLFEWLTRRTAFQGRGVRVFVSVGLVVVLCAGFFEAWSDSSKSAQITYPGTEAELAARYLKAHVTPDDVIVVSSGENAFYWYYARYVGIPTNNIRGIKSRPFHRAFVVIYPQLSDTVRSVISEVGPDLVFFNFDTVHKVAAFQGAEIYTIDGYVKDINQAYGIK